MGVGIRLRIEKKLFSFIWVYLLLISPLSFSAQTGFYPVETNSVQPTETVALFVGGACELRSLTPQESQGLMNLWRDGNRFGELSSGQPANTDRQKLLKDEAIIPDESGELGLKQKLPSQKISPQEVSWLLNNHVNGAFSIGLTLDDSLRAGRCVGDASKDCPVRGKGPSLKNDGTGFSSTVKNIWGDIKGIADGNTPNNVYSPEEIAGFQSQAELQDTNNPELNAKFVSRTQQNALKNVIESDDWEARMQTNCLNAGCFINTYSLFDKFFNSYFSADLVVSSIGPTIAGRLFKGFNFANARFKWPGKETVEKFQKKFSNWAASPNIVHESTLTRIQARERKYSFQAFTDTLTKGEIPLSSNSKYPRVEAALYDAKEGYITKLTTADQKKAFVNQVSDMKTYLNYTNSLKEVADKELADGLIHKTEYAQKISHIAKQLDDSQLSIDFAGAMASDTGVGLKNIGVKNLDTGEIIPITLGPTSGKINTQFAENGVFNNAAGFKYETDGIQNLKIYRVTDNGKSEAVLSYQDFESAVRSGVYSDKTVRLSNGNTVTATIDNLQQIQQGTPGQVTIFGSGWAPAGTNGSLTPDDFAGKVVDFIPSKIKNSSGNLDKLSTSLKEHNLQGQRYFSLLDKAAKEEDQLVKSYLGSVTGAAKWTAQPFGYWWLKQGFSPLVGADIGKEISTYRLPTTWTEVRFYQGPEDIYHDAFIDFFANAGSDQGDLFANTLNSFVFPWTKFVLDPAVEKFTPFNEQYKKLTGKEGRNSVENLAFYISGPQSCESCGLNLSSQNLGNIRADFRATTQLTSFLLEDTISQKAKEAGQTLISFSHHSNVSGKGVNGTGEPIDIAKARRDKTTCADAVENLPFFGGTLPTLLGKPHTVGAILGITENIGYFAFGQAGLIGTAIQQVYIAPELNGCIDEEGYYTHFFVPTPEDQKSQSRKVESNSDKVSKLVDQGKDAITGLLSSQPSESVPDSEKTPITKAVDAVKSNLDTLVKTAQDKDIAEATLQLKGQSNGQLDGPSLFYFWGQPNSSYTPSIYKKEGALQLTSPDANVFIDFAQDKTLVNGKTVVQSPDFSRLATIDTRIPAVEIPQRIAVASVPGDFNPMVWVASNGSTLVKNRDLLNCIQLAVSDQSGVPLQFGESITEAFGPAQAVVTNSHSIYPQSARITAEGNPRLVVETTGVSSNAKIEILGNRDTALYNESNAKTPGLGFMQSIQFQNGVILFNPTNNSFLIWLKHNASAVVDKKDVKELNGKLSTSTNPDTGCSEPAINLEIRGNPDSPLSQQKANNFNSSLAKNGPFQVFDTDKKTFIFYADKDCKPHFKVIDKVTGEVFDQAIVDGTLRQTPNGIEFTTADGKSHSLDFSVQNGVPTLKFNGAEENLLAAQGRNGSFYFDPNSGQYFSENAQLIPLLEAFKQKGVNVNVNLDGKATGTPGINIFNQGSNSGSDAGIFNLPSLPPQPALLLLFAASLIAAFVVIRKRVF